MKHIDKHIFYGYMALAFVFIFLPIVTIIILSFNAGRFASLPW